MNDGARNSSLYFGVCRCFSTPHLTVTAYAFELHFNPRAGHTYWAMSVFRWVRGAWAVSGLVEIWRVRRVSTGPAESCLMHIFIVSYLLTGCFSDFLRCSGSDQMEARASRTSKALNITFWYRRLFRDLPSCVPVNAPSVVSTFIHSVYRRFNVYSLLSSP
jgi:hypothetical protein